MSPSTVNCYIYYRIDVGHAIAARRAIADVLGRVEARAGVAGRLLRRLDEPLLWMEVYENVREPGRFEAILDELLAAHRFGQFLAPGAARTIERFVADSGPQD